MQEEGLRILVLGEYNEAMAEGLRARGVNPLITSLNRDQTRDGVSYPICNEGLRLAASASPDQFDLVLIDDNFGTGQQYAAKLHPSMRHLTLINWETFEPGMEVTYADLGYRWFGSQSNHVNALLKIIDHQERDEPHVFWANTPIRGRLLGETEPTVRVFTLGLSLTGDPLLCARVIARDPASTVLANDHIVLAHGGGLLVQLFEKPDVVWLAHATVLNGMPMISYAPVGLKPLDGTKLLPPLTPVDPRLVASAQEDARIDRANSWS